MTVMNWVRQLRRAARPRRRASLAVESIERRLAPSPTLPLPPPHVPSVAVNFEPPDPCARLAPSVEPPDPCAQLAPTFFPPKPI
jgi:hypothetical protein